jgi:hypothetical protein
MKYLNNLPAFYLIFALFTFVSCDKDLPTDGVEFKKRLVVYAFADNDNVIQVKVAKSLAINDTVGADPIENAIVKILDQSTSKEEILLLISAIFGLDVSKEAMSSPSLS